MVEYTGREVLLKDQNGEVIIPYVSYASSGRNIGDIFYTTRTDTELNGAVECNGGTYNTDDFSGSQSIGNLLSGGKVPYVSLTEYASIVSANGSCRAFGWDGGTSFRVPLLNDVYIEAGTAESAGEFIKESLPNITGNFSVVSTASNLWKTNMTSSGAFYPIKVLSGTQWYVQATSNTNNDTHDTGFDASRSSSTYKNGAKVKPDSVRYRAMVQLAISTTEDAVITATSALQQIANKADVDLGNLSTDGRNYIDSRITDVINPRINYPNLPKPTTIPASTWTNVGSRGALLYWDVTSTSATYYVYARPAGTTTQYTVGRFRCWNGGAEYGGWIPIPPNYEVYYTTGTITMFHPM